MVVLDKHNSYAKIQGASLELGCGTLKRHSDAIGVDALDVAGVDIVGDVFDVLRKVPDSCIRSIYSEHFMEHIEDVPSLMEEMARVLQIGGSLEIVTPHFSNPYYYSDLTHKSVYGLYSLSYFSKGTLLKRQVPTYDREIKFHLDAVNLGFKSARPFYFRHGFKKLLQALFDSTYFMKEYYEENLSQILPCYEIRYRLTRIANEMETV